jgi:Domain of unknown function (DUF4388)
VALLGQLEEFHLQHIVALLQVERQTGELMLEQDGQRACLYFQDGAIVHAVAGKETGYEAALAPFLWTSGKFHFEAYEPEVEPTITASNAAIVAAGRRLAVEAEEVRRSVTSMNVLVHLVPQVDTPAGQINLSFSEWRFLTLVDGRRDLAAIGAQLNQEDFAVRLIANRLVKNHLIDLRDPRQTMLRMTAMPTSLDLRPPADPLLALMDDLTLDMLLANHRDRVARARARVQVLTGDDRSLVLAVEGRPDLADRLLLSEVVMARLGVPRNATVHVRLLDDRA